MMFRIIVRLFLCLLTHATLWSHAQGETCQSKEFPNQRGNQNQWSGYMNLATPAECIDFCCASSSCVAVDYETVNSGCYIFSTPTELTRDASYSYYQVYTAPTTTTPTMLTADERTTTGNELTTTTESNGSAWSGTCPMLLQFRRAVQAPILTLQLSPASCRSLCLFIRDCMAASLLDESCHLLTDPLVWNSGNLQSWSKSCKHSQCCMTQEELSSTGTTLASFKPSAHDCQTACQLVSDCWSVHFASERGTCFLYGESGTEPWEEGGQMFLKSCQTGPSLDSIMLISDCTGGGVHVVPIGLWLTGLHALLRWFSGFCV